jgi:hypothetical protein
MIKQTRDNTCLACVLAMIVGESEQYVLDWFEYQDPPFGDLDAFIFLAHHGFFLALYCKMVKGDFDFEPTTITLDFENRAVYLIVESENYPGLTHAIYWDGKELHDPVSETLKTHIGEYNVLGFYPLMKTHERHKLFKVMKGK